MSSNNTNDQVKIGAYLLERLVQLGTHSVQGVPGDFNMGLLDLIEDHPSLSWVGNSNELNAAYAADGYARIKGTIAAVVTTFGVGELSALNGIAGSFSERLPVIHIVGVPNTAAQGAHSLLHHTLGDGRFNAFENMSKQISADSAILKTKQGAGDAIDRILVSAIKSARPVYLALPTDLVHDTIPADALKKALDCSADDNDPSAEKYVLKVAQKHIAEAKSAVILVDACAVRHGCVAETNDLINKSGLPVFATPMGKAIVDENHAQYGGIYVGNLTSEDVKNVVEEADVLITIGSLKSDFNSGNFSYRTPKESTIELHSDYTTIGYSHYPGIGMKKLLPKLSDLLSQDGKKRLEQTKKVIPKFENKLASEDKSQVITQEWLWPRMGQFFKEQDQVIVETGTSSFGMLEAKLPAKTRWVSQVLWGSIGWSVGATLGVALAAREEKLGRTHLFVGDGSLQLTVQEVGTMIKHGLTPYLFVLNNDGYEIERQIHGEQRSYNDIPAYDHSLLLDFFGNDKVKSNAQSHRNDAKTSEKQYCKVETKQHLDELLKDVKFNKPDRIRLIEIMMRRGDAPKALKRQAEATGSANKYE
ncbi:probable PDC1 - pyruvate decarboxylase, isozyme 1 [Melanopsichium pennsylvanicum]|uniref:Probable PDC1 - pyruvate decarboxylase, isozyme 1 n=2 Tax=Melanopsichium pennsylvanicum TaxID=63383 RepID=A0AAJ4XPX9_9BASI|nr:probable PDC1-pyruvate decarboxylase, isozyme 1 [Melanopsichium pennsylvanicum 4]SNX85737.1 probable PDC1 - pyruvate decarboxylase, isozyme 1 [Melanopsichium pennsylvanicum]